MTQDELKEQLHYSPNTGMFTRLKTFRAVKKGDIAGCLDPTRHGYIRIGVCGKYKDAHRLAFLYMWGYIPEEEIDHINHITSDNRWKNLRVVSHHTNGKNQRKYTSNSSGVTGVRLRSSGKWRARIYHKGSHIDLGTFSTFEAACSARKQAEEFYKFHENHGL
jgi:hypothetical protein